MPKRPGRPPLPPEERRRYRVDVTLNAAELAALDAVRGPVEARSSVLRRLAFDKLAELDRRDGTLFTSPCAAVAA